ncbi:hypothetical protein [Phenylobacterium montanum]|uniref:Lipoprotein n=1 Tax=Phenylobacterium montanum TaxID=2823693 RepID=A0A975FZ27_9CAUL|nr:hypothetical protein [Caulobacter sp. S6]QUD88108.1 hypothetical protein KCG34_24275 [Caulobacter sp. S6]
MTRTVLLAAVVAAGLALSACEKQIEAPMDRGLCTQLVFKNGKAQFNTVSKNEPTLEACAASLEGMRLRFLRLGGSMETISGAYQGQFLFLQPEGVFTSQSFTGARFLLLVRTGDGRLAKLGAGPMGNTAP